MKPTNNNIESTEIKIAKWGYFSLKKIFLFVIAIIGFWQTFEYLIESPNLTAYIEKSDSKNDFFLTTVSITNGSESIINDDISEPISIRFNKKIDSVQINNSVCKPIINIIDSSLEISFSLLNKNEKFNFEIYTLNRPQIENFSCRIKNIDQTHFYDYEKKPSPFNRIFSIWFVIFVASIILLIDALIVVKKDDQLQKIYNYISSFNLNSKNKKEYIKGYKKIYKKYNLRLKPDPDFMAEIIKNLFKSFPHKSPSEIKKIKRWTLYKTDLLTLYRVRTAFLIISPIAIISSITAIIFNLIYYEYENLYQNVSIDFINQILLTIIFTITLLTVIFPRKAMNLLFVKKEARPIF